ncbi:MAG: endo-1,4-beta-xylanase [Planctomycetia bacterium]|nr:endo-1,4-beta-xylanase [Planctomycetia bacterium]
MPADNQLARRHGMRREGKSMRAHERMGMALVAILVVAAVACGADPVPLLPAEPDARLQGADASAGRLELITGPGGRPTLRVTTSRKPAYPWNVSLPIRTTGPIVVGDTLQVTFAARRVASSHETGEAQVDVVVEEAGGDHRKLAESSHSFTGEWADVSLPFRADRDQAAGQAQVALRFGFAPQCVEVANLALVNHGRGVDPATLPRTVRRYPGFAADAPWRRAAADRIEKIRQANLVVEVRDADGRPVPDAQVRVRLERHAFALGTCVTAARILGTAPDDERYRETLARHFTKAVFENDMKWDPWERGGEPQQERVKATIRWLRDHGISPRGHVMVWPSWHNMPPRIRALEHDPPALRRAIEQRVAGQARALSGLLDEWDVVNENYAHKDATDLLGRSAMADWFRIAARETPGTRLFYNDYVMFQGDGPGSPSETLFAILSDLKRSGAPVVGIGEQAHFGGNPPGPEAVLAKLDRFATLGLPIQITEFDIDTADGDLQAAWTRDFLTAVFSHQAVTGVICWGFWEGSHWKPRAAFWDRHWNLRPNGRVWLDLFEKEWTTDARAATDAAGRCTVRAFRGRLAVTAEEGERRGAATADLDADGRVVVTLE